MEDNSGRMWKGDGLRGTPRSRGERGMTLKEGVDTNDGSDDVDDESRWGVSEPWQGRG